MRFFHDQPQFAPVEQDLCNHYGYPPCKELELPRVCPEVWPKVQDNPSVRLIYGHQYGRWCREVSDDFFGYQHIHGHSYAVTAQENLDDISNRFTKKYRPFPRANLEHIMEVRSGQDALEGRIKYNVVQHTVHWGCGRSNSPACLAGHNFPQGPFCPYLLAHRLPQPTDPMTPEAQLLRLSRPPAYQSEPTRRGARDEDLTGVEAAVGYSGSYGEATAVPLNEEFLDQIRTPGILQLPTHHHQQQQQQLSSVPFPAPVTDPAYYYYMVSGKMPPRSLYNTAYDDSGVAGPSSVAAAPGQVSIDPSTIHGIVEEVDTVEEDPQDETSSQEGKGKTKDPKLYD